MPNATALLDPRTVHAFEANPIITFLMVRHDRRDVAIVEPNAGTVLFRDTCQVLMRVGRDIVYSVTGSPRR